MPTPETGTQRRTTPIRVRADQTAVICIECQEGILGADSILPALAADAAPVLDGIEQLTKAARAAGVLVVHATFAGRLGGTVLGSAPLWRAIAPQTADWSDDHPAAAVIDRFHGPGDLVLPRHQGLSPTAGTELLPLLRARAITTIVLAGVSLNVAIPLSAGHAVQEGFDVIVPRDAVAATPAEYGAHALRNTVGMLARVVSVDDLVEAWSLPVTSNHSGG